MTQSQYQNQKIRKNSRSSLNLHMLKNKQLELTLFPGYGCYWNTLRIDLNGKWADLLEPLSGDRPPFRYGSYLMAPWSNRIAQGVFEFEGERFQLRKNFPDDTAIHGDVRTRPWTIDFASDVKFIGSLDSTQFSDFNYPFRLKFRHLLELDSNRLRMSLFVENRDARRAPVGFGFHPFFMRSLSPLDQDIMVVLPAAKVYPDRQCIPTAPPVCVTDGVDLRSERFLGNPKLDQCFTGLTGNTVRLIYVGSKVEVQYRMDSVFSHVVVYAPSRKDGGSEDFVAVEPVTHVNNGFNFYTQGWKGTGVQILEPGQTWGGACELSIHSH